MSVERIVIVGASLAGLRGAEALRERGFSGSLTIVGDEPHEPYDRPPLSKQVALGMVDHNAITLPRARTINATWRLGVAAIGLDRGDRFVVLADGDYIPFDRVLVATGARARPWPVAAETMLRGVVTLRTLEDGAELWAALAAKPRRVVVIGGGFNGSEIASVCCSLGIPVTLVEQMETPLAAALGRRIGAVVADIQRAHGVDLRCGTRVDRLEGNEEGRVCRVHLGDGGSPIEADLVLAALGTEPNIEWLAGSGLAADGRGLMCDAYCRVLDGMGAVAPGIFTAGDVSRFSHPLFGAASKRIEHWSNAVDQAAVAAANMLDETGHALLRYDAVPSFWSSQFDTSIKVVGVPSAGTEVTVVQGEPDKHCFLALYGAAGRPVGAVAFDQAKWLQHYAALIAEGAALPSSRGMDMPTDAAVVPADFPAPIVRDAPDPALVEAPSSTPIRFQGSRS